MGMRVFLGDFTIVVRDDGGKTMRVPFCGQFSSPDGGPIFIGERGELNGLTSDQETAVNVMALAVNRTARECTATLRAKQLSLFDTPATALRTG